ncbi:MAG: hypothetical protein DYH17_04445, partial [Xanthomonadales bacterium PRO6]|nr:hypothetical protein [Xanthomonadales bacterium PRO6]
FEAALRRALLRPRWRSRLPLVAAALTLVAVAAAAWVQLQPPSPEAPVVGGRPPDAVLDAHARLGEARALLEALDSILADSRREVDRLRADLERSDQGRSGGADEDRKALERALEDAEAFAMRAARWALLGDERNRVQGLLDAAQAALDQQRHTDAQAQAGQALELLRSSRAHLLTLGTQMRSLRELQEDGEKLVAQLGDAAPAGLTDGFERDWLAAREAVLDGEQAEALRLRNAFAESLRRATADADGLLLRHWQALATQAVRRGDLAKARSAIAVIEGLAGGAAPARQLRVALESRERGLRAAQTVRDQAMREQQELEREQAAYRPGSGG